MTDFQRQGWVRIYRKSIDSSVWRSSIIWMVWCWCLLKSNHQKKTFPFNGEDVEIKEGQFITGRVRATQEIPISEQQYRTAIKYLEKTKRLTIKTTNKFSLITIIKWEEYQKDNQQSNQPATSQQPASNQPVTTNKNDKNDKKIVSLKKTKVKSKTLKEFRDERRLEAGKGKYTPRRSEKQKETTAALLQLEDFKRKGYDQHGMMFLEVNDEKRNKTVRQLVIRAFKEIGELSGLHDWWFSGAGEWANYEPENCYSTKSLERFKNSKNKIKKQGVW